VKPLIRSKPGIMVDWHETFIETFVKHPLLSNPCFRFKF
jgi:hypothetical protein